MADCLFCKIIAGEVPSDKLYEDDLVAAILDINPRAPRHFLVLPKEHIPTAADIRGEHGPIITRMFSTAARVAKEEGVAESGYRIAFNVGDDAGMSVWHLHMHVLGGHQLGPEG
ncbi:MAG TPA: histidine triad nucleotide-binding protein [Dehalococcoidia bacterium]|nr:histidine triad nucleotide-binding protein [Dehalococcoidia bacterium]